MAFICMNCLREKFENREPDFTSFGDCESCGKHTQCFDIPSSYLISKDQSMICVEEIPNLRQEKIDEIFSKFGDLENVSLKSVNSNSILSKDS